MLEGTEIISRMSYEHFYSDLNFLHLGVIVDKEEIGDSKWSDRDLAKEHGRLSAIEVEVEEYGGRIRRLRARCFPPQSPTLSPGTAPTTGLLGEES